MISLALALVLSADARYAPGGWFVADIQGGCAINQTFEGDGETELSLFLGTDGTALLRMANYNWSTTADQHYPVKLQLDNQSYDGVAIGADTSGGHAKGFFIELSDAFLKDFRSASGLAIFRGDVVVDNVSLRGTAAALAAADKCLAKVRAKEAVKRREKERFSYINTDPFAPAPTSTQAPQPRGNPNNWVSLDDFPTTALAERKRGVVEYSLQVSEQGRAVACKIVTSTGSPDLDAATCRALQQNARFNPAGAVQQYLGKYTWDATE